MLSEIVCRLGLHKWVKYNTQSGKLFRFCERCDKKQTYIPGGSWREIGRWEDVPEREY